MNKEERTKAKVAELMQIYEELPEEKLIVATDLIEQAAFMAVTLEELAEIINEEGVTEEYTNGANQSGRKISSNAKLYSVLIGKYASITTKLLQLVPDRPPKNEENRDQAAVNKERADALRQYEDKQEREKAFLAAMSAGLVKQSDYHAFMAGDITLDSDVG